jgi:hypothetical protein
MAIFGSNVRLPAGSSVRATDELIIGQYVSAANQVTLSGADVTRWNDRSGFNGAAVTSSVGNPTFSATAWNGSQPGVQYAATEQALVNTSGAIATYMSVNSNPFTIISALQSDITGNQHAISWMNAGHTARISVGVDDSGDVLTLRVSTDLGQDLGVDGVSALGTTPHVVAVAYTGAAVSLVVDGALEASVDFSFSQASVDRFYLGGAFLGGGGGGFRGTIAEVRVYTRALSMAEIQLARAELKQVWGGLP